MGALRPVGWVFDEDGAGCSSLGKIRGAEESVCLSVYDEARRRFFYRDKSIYNFDYLSYNYSELKDEPERV
jgi:hypothetical protein